MKQFWSESRKSKELDINSAVVVTTATAGIGYSTLEEMYTDMNIPCMSEVTYIKHREILVDDFKKTAIESMTMACEVEKQLAVERNEIINDIPYTTVIVQLDEEIVWQSLRFAFRCRC